MDLIQLDIKGISYSQTQTGAYALILEENRTKKKIPIVIGAYEAQSIAISLEKDLHPPRPLTHDLFKFFADAYEVRLHEIIIHKLIDGVFYSNLIWEKDGIKTAIDSRTSDACALAVRFNVPIFTTVEIIEKAGVYFEEEAIEQDEKNNPIILDTELEKRMTSTLENEIIFSNISKEELRTMLNEAVTNEDYELAAKLRDELDKRN
ncbi:MAG: bifunctional nuclease domain-containing protein [Flavobacteriales bacterium]